jgi:hypothetical protein
LSAQLGNAVVFARRIEADRYEELAQKSNASGDQPAARHQMIQAGFLRRAPSPTLTALFAPYNVSQSELQAAFADKLIEMMEPQSTACADGSCTQNNESLLPSPPTHAEILEDAAETTNMAALSPGKRAGYQSNLAFGIQRFTNRADSSNDTTGFTIGGWGAGAVPYESAYTCVGGGAHAYANIYGGGYYGAESSVAVGVGVKLAGLCILPIAGMGLGYSTHADQKKTDYAPARNIHPSIIDGEVGGQLTYAFPYPVNLVVNARVVRTIPAFTIAPSYFGTNYELSVGWQWRSGLVVALFLRHAQMVDQGRSTWSAWSDGSNADRSLTTLSIGIGGGGIISPLGKLPRSDNCDIDQKGNVVCHQGSNE